MRWGHRALFVLHSIPFLIICSKGGALSAELELQNNLCTHCSAHKTGRELIGGILSACSSILPSNSSVHDLRLPWILRIILLVKFSTHVRYLYVWRRDLYILFEKCSLREATHLLICKRLKQDHLIPRFTDTTQRNVFGGWAWPSPAYVRS